MRSLILGVTGCAGSHLADYLLEKGYEVTGTKRNISSTENIEHILDKIRVVDINLNDKKRVSGILKEFNPDQIYFLVSAKHSDSISDIYETNVKGTMLFFEALLESSCCPRIVTISSSAVYGVQKEIQPIKENAMLNPSNHYALTKMMQEEIAKYYCVNHNMDVVIARPFNHPGPKEHAGLVCTDFARKIIDIEVDSKEQVMHVSKLDNIRDFTDVRDSVRAYVLLGEKGRRGETYNVCSGKPVSVRMVLDTLISMSSIHVDIQVESNESQKKNENVQTGDYSKLSNETGWKPEIPIEKTLKDTLEYYRGKK